MVELPPRTNRLDFGTDPRLRAWIHDGFFHFSNMERQGTLGIKYELKELRMNLPILEG